MPLKILLEALLQKNPRSPQEASIAVNSLLDLFQEAEQKGMNAQELQSYHALFSEPIQTWSQKIYSRS